LFVGLSLFLVLLLAMVLVLDLVDALLNTFNYILSVLPDPNFIFNNLDRQSILGLHWLKNGIPKMLGMSALIT
jgi:hypothetical protein